MLRRGRIGAWLGLLLVGLLSGIGWLRWAKIPGLLFALWLLAMILYGVFLFFFLLPALAPAAPHEAGLVRRAFAAWIFGRLRSLGVVDAGQPRASTEPLQGPGLWLMDARSALAVEGEAGFLRIAGPGLTWVQKEEQITAFVDLRPQRYPRSEPEPVTVRTQDGLSLGFQIRTVASFAAQRPPPVERGLSPYFYPAPRVARSIAQALRAARVDEDRTLHWFELAAHRAREELALQIGNRLFDELFRLAREGTERPDPPLARLAQEIQRTLVPELSRAGIRLDRLRLALAEVPEEARRQRVEVWRSQWAARLARWIGLAESELLLEYARARHAAQMETLQALREVLSGRDALSPDLILLHFLETLDAAVRKSGLLLPEELNRLRTYLQGGSS
jgi:hypothetical protein